MIRRCNYTGRKVIDSSEVSVRVSKAPEYLVDLVWGFASLSLPPDASVVLEAFTGGSAKIIRLPWGSVAAPAAPADRSLAELAASTFLFNLKVVDSAAERAGRILAVARSLRPSMPLGENPKREELFAVNAKHDMGHEIWSLDFTHEQVWLNVNANIGSYEATVQSDPRFFSLVYPQVVRQVLSRLVQEEVEDASGWREKWLTWTEQSLGATERPPSGDGLDDLQTAEQSAWIDQMVRRFCDDKAVLDKWNGAREVTS